MILSDFAKGDRVELHPGTDLWMRGARYGTVEDVGRKALRVSIDRLKSRVIRIMPANIYAIVGHLPVGGAIHV